MSDFDLDRLGEMWRQPLDPAEIEKLRRSGASVSQRARWGQVVDIVASVAVTAVVLYFAVTSPSIRTFGVSSVLILILLWSQQRQRRLRAIEIKSLTGTSEEMLDQSIAQTEATLKRIRFQLVLAPPGFASGLAFAALAGHRSAAALWEDVVTSVQGGEPIVLFALAFLPALAIYSLREMRNRKRQLERLTALREAYREEREAQE